MIIQRLFSQNDPFSKYKKIGQGLVSKFGKDGLYFYFWKDNKSGVDCFCLSVDDQDYICFGFKGGNYYKLSRLEFFDLSREKKIKESEIDDYIKKTIEGDISVSFLLKDNKRKDVLIDKECKYILGAL
jgi:hypothetical protein